LGEHFMSRVALHAIQPAGMDRHDCSLHIYKVVFAQSAHPFTQSSNECATPGRGAQIQPYQRDLTFSST
jgi:hypothetical protein